MGPAQYRKYAARGKPFQSRVSARQKTSYEPAIKKPEPERRMNSREPANEIADA